MISTNGTTKLMSIDLVKLDRALNRSLEAAVDTALWKNVLTEIAAATGSFGANIIPLSQRNRHLIVHTDSMAPAFEDYFDGGWHIHDWRQHGLPLLKRYGVVSDHQYTSRDAFERHDYYKFHAKHGIRNGCMIGWNSRPEDLLILTLHQRLDASPPSSEEIAVFMQMQDRLMVSAKIMSHLSESRTSAMSEAFEMSGLAAILFDRFGYVTQVTRDAEYLLGRDLIISGRELKSKRHDETLRIRKRMHAVINEKWLGPDPETIGPIFVQRDGARPLCIRIQRLGGNVPDFFAHSIGVCLVDDLQSSAAVGPENLRRHFGLTPRQAMIASRLCEGQTLREIADDARLSYETVRSHLRAIFEKTDTKRQSELVSLAGRIASRNER